MQTTNRLDYSFDLSMNNHPFDQAIALQPEGSDPDLFIGATSPGYWNMVGPFGGATAAVMLQAVLVHPKLLGTPIALTVNFASAIGAGPFTVRATPVRTNRSTQHWTMTLSQAGEDGAPSVSTTATAVTAARRETWSASDMPMPSAPAASQSEGGSFAKAPLEWLARYQIRIVSGDVPTEWDGSGSQSETLQWVRDDPPRALDFASLAAMSDVFFPRIWLRRATHVPAGTVSITTYFHADAAQLAEVSEGHLLGRATGQRYDNGFFDQSAQLWSEAGALLATSSQIVYYKE